jgi:hypothetical protein
MIQWNLLMGFGPLKVLTFDMYCCIVLEVSILTTDCTGDHI